MGAVNFVVGKVFEAMFWPLGALGPWPAMLIVSLMTGVLMLVIFRWTSNQSGIRRTKDKIKAHLLEIRLFKDSLGQSLKAQGRVLEANVRYASYALRPMLVMFIPVLLILFQLNLRFGVRALRPGESVILKIRLAEAAKPEEVDVRLQVPSGVVLETPPVRIAESREMDWRLSGTSPGRHPLIVKAGPKEFTVPLVVGGNPLAEVPAIIPGRSLLDQLSHPGTPPVPKGLPVASVEIGYPSQDLRLLGLNVHWLVAFFGLSLVFGFALKGVMKVEI
jgi:hypothetical protein